MPDTAGKFKGAARKGRPPLALLIPALVVALGTCLPALWLVLRAFDVEPGQLGAIVFRPRNLQLLGNTLKLVAVVLAIGTFLALPMAWAVTRSDIGQKRLLNFLMALPLAIPGYVMAYALLGLSGYYGFARQWFGLGIPPLHGLWGAGLALSLYTFPYMFLNLRAAFMGMDPGLEESAAALGASRWQVFRRVQLPQLWPALAASWLVVGLYVIGDFGAIALMRYEVFSWAIYTQYSGAMDRSYAAWLSLMLLGLTVAAVMAQQALARARGFARTGTGTPRPARPIRLGPWRWLVRAWAGLIVLASIGLPLLVLLHWMHRGLPEMDWLALARAGITTALLAAPAALLAVALALPVVLLSLRWPSRFSRLIDRLAHIGYATPPLSFALAMVFFSLQLLPWFYQSLPILVFAYVMSFLALAFGPIRLALQQIGTRHEEAARALGSSPLAAFRRAVLPRLRRPMVAGGLLVFIMVAKELPITYILAPTGIRTLSTQVFARTNEGMMAEAAPFALAIILFSSLFVGLILQYEGRGRRG